MVTTGGLEPPLDRLSTCCLCRIGLHGHGPSGWTRTTTARVKGPACCVDTTEGEWSEWRDSNPHLKAWKARRQPLPHTRFGWTGIDHRPIDNRRLSKTPLLRAGADGFGDKAPLRPGPRSRAGSRPKQKRPSGGSPRKAWFSMNAGFLRRVAPLGVVERAALAAEPRLFRGSARRGRHSLEAGQMEWPRHRRARRIEDASSQLKPRWTM